MKRKASRQSRSPLAMGKRAGGAALRFFSNPVKDSFGELGAAIRIERDLRAVPIGRAHRELSKIYTYALYGVAILTILAWFNNRAHFAGAFLLALILGAMYVIFIAHRQLFLTAGAVIWWAATAPFVALLTADDNALQLVNMQLASSTPLLWATGAGVWLLALLMRVRRPWLMLLSSWVIVFGCVLATARWWDPGYAYYVSWTALAVYFTWRSGALLTIADFVRGRGELGRDYEEATETQYEVYKHLNELPRGYRIFRQLASPATNGVEMVDALVAGPTGLFYIAAVPAEGEVTVAAGRPRRILVKKKAIDRILTKTAITARSLRMTLDLDMTTIVTLHGAEFPNRGLLAVKVRPGKIALANGDSVGSEQEDAVVELVEDEDATDEVGKLAALKQKWRDRKNKPKGNRVFDDEAASLAEPLTLLDPELLGQRIKFGTAVYTSGQLGRIVHRVRARLQEVERPKDEAELAPTDESDTADTASGQLALR